MFICTVYNWWENSSKLSPLYSEILEVISLYVLDFPGIQNEYDLSGNLMILLDVVFFFILGIPFKLISCLFYRDPEGDLLENLQTLLDVMFPSPTTSKKEVNKSDMAKIILIISYNIP